jgi:hypothetical protein
LRIAGTSFQPHVFAPGKYTVKVSEPETKREKIVAGVDAMTGNAQTLDVRI